MTAKVIREVLKKNSKLSKGNLPLDKTNKGTTHMNEKMNEIVVWMKFLSKNTDVDLRCKN